MAPPEKDFTDWVIWRMAWDSFWVYNKPLITALQHLIDGAANAYDLYLFERCLRKSKDYIIRNKNLNDDMEDINNALLSFKVLAERQKQKKERAQLRIHFQTRELTEHGKGLLLAAIEDSEFLEEYWDGCMPEQHMAPSHDGRWREHKKALAALCCKLLDKMEAEMNL